MLKHSFGSDNHSGVHPLIMKAIEDINHDFNLAYGEDPYTEDVLRNLENLLGGNCKALFVFNGTGANAVALSTFCKTYNSILAPRTAHILVDECGAVEKLSGCKIVPLNCKDGKVTPKDVEAELEFGDQHHTQPAILSISEPTELGTLYSAAEIKTLADLMHKHGCYLHVDGSRIANAAAALKTPIKNFISDTGADVLSFGGTKNGLLVGEAVVVLNAKKNKIFADSLMYYRKQATQLYSKNRFIAAQFEAYLKDDLYLKMASHSNAMAKYLEKRVKEVKCVKISKKVQSNAVFAILPVAVSTKLEKKHFFHVWDKATNEVRWMCAFNTQKSDIDIFIEDLKKAAAK